MAPSFLRFRPDIPFSRDDSNRFLPWIIAFIVFITAMMIASGSGLYDIARSSHAQSAGSLSIHIPASAGSQRQVDALTQQLAEIKGVKKVRSVTAGEMQELMQPWLGGEAPLELLPLPRIVEVSVSGGMDRAPLEKKIAEIAPGASVDDHAEWLSQYAGLIAALQWGLWIAALLFIGTTLAIVVLATRASIRIHHRIIQILHTIGALDGYIARQFQHNLFLVTARGAFAGSALACVLYILLCFTTSRLESELIPRFTPGISQFILFISLPLLVSISAMISSRLTVLAELRRMP